ncbi:MAG: LytTR family transcriptional regulator, partial [Sinomicrobium sp.]|nr:LytTR family transcriptional regulator [Sinomicrobium sp.]
FQHGAEVANHHFNSQDKHLQSARVSLCDEQGKPAMELEPERLLFVAAADNYIELHITENEKVRRELIRNTLSAVESVLEPAGFLRCHRSYLVNPDLVVRVSGNAQGYRLHFAETELSVPVARGRNADVLSRFR